MKKIIYIIVAVILIALVVFRLKSNKETTKNRVFQYEKEQAIHVQALTIKLENATNLNYFSGTFEAIKETKVSADIQGKINAIFVDNGSVVKSGQTLVQLDNSLLKLQLQSSEIQIEGLESDVKRYSILAKADAIQGVQLEKAILGLKSAKIQRATLEEQIKKTSIVAPFSGIVTAKFTEEGAFAAPGIPLIQITDISKLRFTANVSENDLKQFSLNEQFTLVSDAYPETNLVGKLTLTGSKSNLGSSFPIQFTVDNTIDLKIKSGMFGKVIYNDEIDQKYIIIPSSSIIGTNIKPQVYKINNGKAILQNITISKRISNKVIVSSGLIEGDKIVTNGFINLFDGANVNIK